MARKILAGIAGFVTTFATIMLVQAWGHAVFPPPPELDLSDPEAAARLFDDLPWGALACVLFAYFAGAFLGTFVAKWLGGGSGKPYALILGGFVLGGTLVTVYQIPHPPWFVGAAIIGIPAAAWLGAKFGPRRIAAGKAAET
jgi:hypothetical protein